jgi:5-methylcytosine-specific restriction protein A
MKTYLLTWNPTRFDWDMEQDISALKSHGFFDGRWSCGRTKRIEAGDRLFLLRQGQEPRGIVASGYAKSSPHTDVHWDESRSDEALYVEVRFDTLLVPDRDGVLPLSKLQQGPLGKVIWRTQASGISIAPLPASMLERLWRAFLEDRGQSPTVTPEEINSPALFFEGASRTIAVNAYERDPRARKACIDHYGTNCSVCGFNFAEAFGDLGNGFIHVHHLVPLADIGKSYVVDPVRDLRPVCPNCHAMLHRREEVLTIEKLKSILKKSRPTTP